MSVKTSISWADITINPITGCLNNCEYCYARHFAQRLRGRFGYPADEPFRPTFHMDKVDEIYNLSLKGKGRIFLDSMGDWFSEGVEPIWIKIILDRVKLQPNYTFLVLTKRPDRISEMLGGIYKVPRNLWLGASVTEQTDTWRIKELNRVCCNQFVSFEPLHGSIKTDLSEISWVIIGAETGNRKGKIEPNEEWVKSVFNCLPDDGSIPIFMKDNLMPYLPEWSQIKDFPEAMKR